MQPASLDVIRKLLAIDSCSSETEILSFIEKFFTDNNIEVTRIPVSEGRYDILAQKGEGEGGLLLCGHCDTVDTEPHYEPYVEGDVLHGIGASDMKAGLGACMQFLADYQGKGPLGVLVTVGEETIFDGAKAALDNPQYFTSFSQAIVAEPTDLKPIASQFGLAQINLSAEGIQRHTASFKDGDNPIHTLSEQIVSLTRSFNEAFPDSILSVNSMHGGEQDNVIPENATAIVDIRLVPGTSISRVNAFIENTLTTGWEKRNWVEPVEERDTQMLQNLKRITKEETTTCKGFTEMYFYDKLGLNTVIFGPGLMEKAHMTGETVPLNNIQRFETILRELSREAR